VAGMDYGTQLIVNCSVSVYGTNGRFVSIFNF
jgi:hypothetical protein